MSDRERRRQAEDPRAEAVTVSPLAVPLLLGGVVIGFLSGYFLVWAGGLVVLAAGAAAAVLARRSRDGAIALILGAVVGYVLVLALALFRGVI